MSVGSLESDKHNDIMVMTLCKVLILMYTTWPKVFRHLPMGLLEALFKHMVVKE